MTDSVSLTFYNAKYLNDLSKIDLPADQLRFTQTPTEVMDTLEDKERRLVLILNNDVCVGYFILHGGEGPVSLGFDNALLIRSLALNPSQQGKGLAFHAMSLLPEFVNAHYSHINKLVLVVNEKNIAAQKLYQKIGFIEHSSRNNEEHGLQFIYCYGF